MANVVCWDSDGTTFRVYSNDTLVLQTPIDPASGTPTEALVIDPATGLPATFGLAGGGFGLPSGARGDLLWHNGTAWVPLSPSGTQGYVLTEQTSGSTLVPVWSAPGGGSPPTLPPPVTPTPEYQCAVAQFVGGQLVEGYNLLAAWMLNQSQAEVALFLAGAGNLPADITLVLVEAFGGPLVWGASLLTVLLTILINARNAGQLLPISPQGTQDVSRALYCALRHQGPTQLIIDGTTLFDWSENLTAVGLNFIGLQVGVLRQCIVSIPQQQWVNWSAQAAASTSLLCVDYDCTGMAFG